MKKLPKLEYWANYYGKMYWGREIKVPITWKIMSRWNGVVYSDGNQENPRRIHINPTTVQRNIFHQVLLHELCHYFLIEDKIKHKETSEVFLKELRRVGGIMPWKVLYNEYICIYCKQPVYSGKRWDKQKYLQNKKCSCPNYTRRWQWNRISVRIE